MTLEQWDKLEAKNVLRSNVNPQFRVALVQQDHIGRWIGLVIAAKGDVMQHSCVVEHKPEVWTAL